VQTQAVAAQGRSWDVPSESFPVGSAIVNLATGHSATPEVEVLYPGTQPPMALFGHLTALAFAGLVPTPPPASAIDWQTPDPAGGRAFSVRPFDGRALGRLEAPQPDRERAIVATRYLLARLAGTQARTPAAHVAPNGDANGSANGNGSADGIGSANGIGRLMAADVASSGAWARRDGADAFTLGTPAPSVAPDAPSQTVVLEVVLDELSADRARRALEGLARVTDERLTSWTTEQTYRGSRTTTSHRAIRLLVEAGTGDVDAVLAALAPYRPRSIGMPSRT
jgi:hypothetical protein